MEMGLDESRGDETPLDVNLSCLGGEVRRDRHDPPPVDADVRRARAGRLGDSCMPQNEIDSLLPCVCISNRRCTGMHRPARLQVGFSENVRRDPPPVLGRLPILFGTNFAVWTP